MTAPARRLAAVPQSPEQDLRRLFAEEDALRRQLAVVEQEQKQARNQYAEAKGLLMRPSVASLRKVLG